jgi:hypothetical protein
MDADNRTSTDSLTGEPDAGNPPVRFGGRGGVQTSIPTPIFRYRHSSRIMRKLNWQVQDRVRRWLWRKHGQKKGLWKHYPAARLHGQYGLWPLPETVANHTP